LDTWFTYWCVLRRVAGWVAGGCWDDDWQLLWIIPDNSPRLAPVRWYLRITICKVIVHNIGSEIVGYEHLITWRLLGSIGY
jgi:hypothetical protein